MVRWVSSGLATCTPHTVSELLGLASCPPSVHTHTLSSHTHTLHSPTESEAKGTADILDFQEVNKRLHSPLAEFVSSQHAQTLCFWAEEETYDHVELGFGQAVRLKTKGDSPFIGNINFVMCSVAKVITCLLLTSLSEKLRHCSSCHVYLSLQLLLLFHVCMFSIR